jgi:hypothetical protein
MVVMNKGALFGEARPYGRVVVTRALHFSGDSGNMLPLATGFMFPVEF